MFLVGLIMTCLSFAVQSIVAFTWRHAWYLMPVVIFIIGTAISVRYRK